MFGLLALVLFVWYVFNRLTLGIAKGSRCLVGKTVIVTGGNSGIGFHVCVNLAARGCRLIIADVVDTEATRRLIIQRTGNTNIISKKLDLSSFESVREFAKDINATEARLDILVNNAGVGNSPIESTADGLHSVLQINYFGPFLLTHLLIDLLKRTKPSRIIFTSSCMAFTGLVDPQQMSLPNRNNNFFSTLRNYSDSKQATVMASDIFAKKLEGTGVTCNSLHPGIVSTPIYQTIKQNDFKIAMIILANLLSVVSFVVGKSAWEGAQTTTHLAICEDLETVTGKYFWDCRPFLKPRLTRNEELCRKIWRVSEELVKLAPSEKI